MYVVILSVFFDLADFPAKMGNICLWVYGGETLRVIKESTHIDFNRSNTFIMNLGKCKIDAVSHIEMGKGKN